MREIIIQKERDKHGSRDRHTLLQSVIKKIAGHYYTHLETMKKKEIRIKRRTYTRRITDNIPDTETDREKEREKRGSKHLPIHVQSLTI